METTLHPKLTQVSVRVFPMLLFTHPRGMSFSSRLAAAAALVWAGSEHMMRNQGEDEMV